MMKPPSVPLPHLKQFMSPNQSVRSPGVVPFLVVVHRPVGSYAGAVRTLTSPGSKVSAHIITNSNVEATQLVPWHMKAWACGTFNSASYNVEVDDNAWDGTDKDAFYTAARIVAFLCKRTGIPPTWSTDPSNKPGVVRHYDLGRAGGGHTDPTLDRNLWIDFIRRVAEEHHYGQFRPTYGVGRLERIDT